MYEYDEETKKVDFSHNFSMPQGGLEALRARTRSTSSPSSTDIVCNGVELSSGAIRNHRPDIMYKAFEIAGYSQADVDTNFAGMITPSSSGAPPRRVGRASTASSCCSPASPTSARSCSSR
jgi:aspartyl-tRNA synthetase